MSGKKSGLPDGRVPDRNPDGTLLFPCGLLPQQVEWL